MSKLNVANEEAEAAKVIAKSGECVRLLLMDGLKLQSLQEVINNPKFRVDVVTFMNTNGLMFRLKEHESHHRARAIMGKNFLGLPEVYKHFGLPDHVILAMEKIPFSEETLRACSETHVLIADIGLSVDDIDNRDFYVKGGSDFSYLIAAYSKSFENLDFLHETENACWRLIRKTAVENSMGKKWEEQCNLIQKADEIPSARQVIYMFALNHLSTGEQLFKVISVRTSSDGFFRCRNYPNQRVVVGCFEPEWGIGFDGMSPDETYDYLGIASARKPDLTV